MQIGKHTLTSSGLILSGLLLSCLIVGFVLSSRMRASQGPGPSGAPITSLARAPVAVIKLGSLTNTLSIAGEFLPYQELEVHAKVTGYIRKIYVDIGDRVKTGQVLAVLEVPELTAQVESADATVRHSRDEILRAQNEVTRAEATHTALHAAATRLQEAWTARPGLIAQQELDDAVARDRAAEALVEGAKSSLSAAQQQLGVSKANHSQVSAMSNYSRITAPFDGTITWRYADTGALVQAGTSSSSSQPVLKLAEVDVLRLRMAVPEAQAANLRYGATAEVTVQATGEHFAGKVARTTDALDRSTRTMQVEVDVPNQTRHLSPGMYANVVLQAQNRANVLTAPVQAINHESGKTSVLLVDGQNRVQEREVHIGIETSGAVEILSGLQAGDRVIVGNSGVYREGQVIDPKLRDWTARDATEGEL